ncbi:TcaA 3rd/4th domain-containing protein [Clostridium sp. HCS.1]|uniref:TcaA 3rd/4th domain-containing protein n=1 Tax=Clostridium sp. HCS.1 TaxID=3238594 RepID=UPI003A0FD386
MNKLKEVLKYLREYFNLLKEDISGVKLSTLKEFLIKRKFLLIGVLLLFTLMGFSVGSYKSSKNIILKNLEIALKDNRPGKIYREVKFQNKRISKSDFEPLAEYYSENPSRVSNIIKDLKNNGESRYFTLVNKKILFFDNYHIEISPVAIKINTNFDNSEVYINDKEITDTNLITNLIPGKYLIKGKLNTLYGLVEAEKELYIVENMEYSLNMPALNINLTSNFEDADVFINDEKINKKVKDIKKYGPIPLNKQINIQLQKEFPWGVIKSDKVQVSSLPNINIDINMVNEKLINDVNKSTDIFYSSVFNALNSSDSSLILNSKEDTRSKIYDSIIRESLFLKNNYELNDLKTELKSSEFYYENGTYKGNVVINLNYNVKKKLLPFLKNNVEEMFLTHIEYEDNNWIINDVQKFSID